MTVKKNNKPKVVIPKISQGDMVYFAENSHSLQTGMKPNHLYEVVGVDKDARTVFIDLDGNNKLAQVDIMDCLVQDVDKDFDRGYKLGKKIADRMKCVLREELKNEAVYGEDFLHGFQEYVNYNSEFEEIIEKNQKLVEYW